MAKAVGRKAPLVLGVVDDGEYPSTSFLSVYSMWKVGGVLLCGGMQHVWGTGVAWALANDIGGRVSFDGQRYLPTSLPPH